MLYLRLSSAVVLNLCLAVYINFTSLLDSLEGVGSVGAWVRRWRESNFGIGLVGLQNFGEDKKKNGRGRNSSMGET